MTKPAILTAIDDALDEKYPRGLRVLSDERNFGEAMAHLEAWEEGFQRELVYRGVTIRCGIISLPDGYAIKRLPGHDRHDPETGQFQADEP